MTEICEICGKRLETKWKYAPLQFLTLVEDKWLCVDCAKPFRRIDRDKEETKDHPNWCACHGCQRMVEYGYTRCVNKDGWTKRPTVICKSANFEMGCGTCQHSIAHIKSEKYYCDCECNGNRTVGCVNI